MALAALSVLLPVCYFAWLGFRTYHSEFEDARTRLERSIDLVREHAAKVFETHQLVTQQVDEILYGFTDAQIRDREKELHERLAALVDRLDQIQDIWVLDRNGFALVAGKLFPVPKEVNYADRIYFRVHRENSGSQSPTYISEILQGRVLPTRFFQFSEPRRYDADTFVGVIAISVEPKYFQDFYKQVAQTGLNGVALIREDGAVLARFAGAVEDLTDLPRADGLLQSIKSNPNGGYFERRSSFDGIERLIGYHKVGSFPVYVSASIDRAAIVDRWRREFTQHMVFALPATLFLLGLSLIAGRLTRQQATALSRLRDEAARRETSESQVRQMQKIQAVGQLTGGIAHDFNNMLAIILGSLKLLQRRLARGQPLDQSLIDAAITGGERAAALTARLLSFARQQALRPETVDCNKLLTGTAELLRRTIPESIHIETVLAAGLWRIWADPLQLENAIVNLAVNARDAMPEGGKLTIEAANAWLDDSYSGVFQISAGQYVLVSVSDNGHGMSPEVLSSAFDPFFTTKPAGRGSGLGLSQVHGFIRQSGGHVQLYSELGQGTTVKLYLPRAKPDSEPVPPKALDTILPTANAEKVLLVEDEAEVRSLTSKMLRELGYQVVSVESAEAALASLDEHHDIAVLFTDVVMPGMNGPQLAAEVVKRRPAVKLLFTTGYTPNAMVHNGVLEGDVSVIIKPYTIERLATKLSQLLAQ